jgi:AcrR family transcriptional regulator
MAQVAQHRGACDRILVAAHDLFYRDGIRATGVDRVIAEAAVTKVTFYRHFPSKQHLVHAFLEYRHRLWMEWFRDALRRHRGTGRGIGLDALPLALKEWFTNERYRGCAFINSMVEFGGGRPEIREMVRLHKREMTEVIADLLPPKRHRKERAETIALAVDGAIVRAQMDDTPDAALALLRKILTKT